MSVLIVLGVVVTLSITAVLSNHRWLRVVCCSLVLLTMLGTLIFPFQSVARDAAGSAATFGSCSRQFVDGITAYMEATAGIRLVLAICSIGLFSVAVVRRNLN